MSLFDRWQHRHTVLSVSVLAYFGIRFVEFVLSIVFKDIKTTLGISTFVIGLAVAASTVTYAIVQFPSGALGDRFGHRRVVLTSLGLTGVSAVMLAVAPSGLIIILGMALVGFVSGAYYSPATALLTDLFDETGRAIGIHRLGAQAVGVTGPGVGVLAAMYGWRTLLLASGITTLPVLASYRKFVRHRPPANPGGSLREQVSPATAWELLSRPSIGLTTVIAALAQFVDTATFSFLPLLLREYHGLSLEVTGLFFTIYFVAVAVSQPAAGWLADQVNRDAVTAGTLTIAFLGYLLLGSRPSVSLIGVGVVGLGVGMGWGPPVQARIMDTLDRDERGVGFGLVRSTYIGIAALNGLVVGGTVTLVGWTAGINVLLLTLSIPIVLIVVRYGVRSL